MSALPVHDTQGAVAATVERMTTATLAVAGFASALPEHERAELLARGHQRRYPRNARVFCEGDSSDFVIVILEGRVKIVVTTEDGNETLLAYVGPASWLVSLQRSIPNRAWRPRWHSIR